MRHSTSRILLFAGRRGWENPEYVEFQQSAIEFLGPRRVVSSWAPKGLRTFWLSISLVLRRPSHFLYDPRWGSTNRILAVIEAHTIKLTCHITGCVPIGLLNDIPEITWRRKLGIVCNDLGVCLVLVSPKTARREIPEITVAAGPTPMPMSRRSLRTHQQEWPSPDSFENQSAPVVTFVGSLYEPRESILSAFGQALDAWGIEFKTLVRDIKEPKIPRSAYMKFLATSDLTVTTADQMKTDKSLPIRVQHLVYRYIEALAAGTVLIAPTIEGAEEFLEAGTHFIRCDDISSPPPQLRRILMNRVLLEKIRLNARQRIRELTEEDFFWTFVNRELKSFGRRTLT